MMKRGIQLLQKLKKTLKKSFVRTELFDAVRPELFNAVRPEPCVSVRPEPVEGTNGAQDMLVEGVNGAQEIPVKCDCNKLIINNNLISSWFDRLATNELNQRFLNGYARLAIILSLSLLVHLAIIYGVPWSPAGEKNIARFTNTQHGQHRLTVTLTPAAPAATARQTTDKSEVPIVVETEADLAGGESLPAIKTLLSTALDTRYFTVAELDQHPAIARDIPDNPPELLEHSQGGEIVLRLWIDKTGGVVSVDTVSSNLPPVFVDSARAGFLQAVFLPGRKNGNAVATVMDIVVSYAPVNQIPQH